MERRNKQHRIYNKRHEAVFAQESKTTDEKKARRGGTAKRGTIISFAAAALLVVCLVWVNLTIYPNLGNVAGTIAFSLLLAAVIFRRPLARLILWLWKRKAGKALLCMVGAAVAFGVALCIFFSVNMLRCADKDSEGADCVIVLGCQVQGEIPSYMLQDRLAVAKRLLDENPSAVCIVSGGQGNREYITEAEAMRRWLVKRGIDDSRIIMEDKATSTKENLLYSAEIVKEREIGGHLVVVTNEFHQYRADIFAKRAGLSVGHASAKTSTRLILNYWIREWLGLVKAFFE